MLRVVREGSTIGPIVLACVPSAAALELSGAMLLALLLLKTDGPISGTDIANDS